MGGKASGVAPTPRERLLGHGRRGIFNKGHLHPQSGIVSPDVDADADADADTDADADVDADVDAGFK